jgi:AraC-like DNA-binding protein
MCFNILLNLKIHIRYMVSIRCKMAVKSVLEKMDIPYKSVDLGEVNLINPLTEPQTLELSKQLHEFGLELMDDKKTELIEKVKTIIAEMVHYSEEVPKVKNSEYISEKLLQDYSQLSRLFSEVTGTTIENYIISHKIERVKEMLLYDELNLTEIAYKLNYSSVAHLSNQFKHFTGLTPSFFKKMQHYKSRVGLEEL